MAFPVAGVLDAFTRSNGAPGANWGGTYYGDAGSLVIASNALKGNDAVNFSSGYWSASRFAKPCEAYVDIVTRPVSGQDLWLELLHATTGTSDVDATPDGYGLDYHQASVDGSWNLYKLTAGGQSLKASGTITGGIANGDALGLAISSSNVITVYRRSSGAWSTLGTYTDSTSPWAGPFYIGLEMNSTTTTVDNLGGGSTGSALTLALSDTVALADAQALTGNLHLADTVALADAATPTQPGGLFAIDLEFDTTAPVAAAVPPLPQPPVTTATHLAWPFRMGLRSLQTVEQDSLDDLQQSVHAYLATPRGSRPLNPTFGLDDPTFGPGIDPARLASDIEASEGGRSDVSVTIDGPGAGGAQSVRVTVKQKE